MKFLLPQDCPPPVDFHDWANRHYLWLLGLMIPIAASSASIMLGAAIFLILFNYLRSALRFELPRSSLPMAWAAMLYVASMAFAAFSASDGWGTVSQSVILVPFLAVLLVPPSCWRSPLSVNFSYLSSGAANGLCASLAIAVIELLFFPEWLPHEGRASILSGNPVPAAYAVVIFTIVAALGLDRLSGDLRLFRAGAIVAGVFSAILTGSISVITTLPMLFLVFAWRYRAFIRPLFGVIIRWKGVSATFFAAFIMLLATVFAYSPLVPRAERYVDAAFSNSSSPEAVSLHEREAMWKAAYLAALDSPWTGYGIRNRFSAIVPYLPPEFKGRMHFTHVHNGFLTALLAGGLPALAATVLLLATPFFVAFRFANGVWREDMLALTLGAALVYCIAGMVGIMFFQDATDAIYCWIMVIAAVFSAPEKAVEPVPGGQ